MRARAPTVYSHPFSFHRPLRKSTPQIYLQLSSSIAFRSAVRRTLLIPTHVRLSKPIRRLPPACPSCSPTDSLLSSSSSLGTLRAPCMSARRRGRLYGKKKGERKSARTRKTETKRVSEYLVWPYWLIRLTFLSRDESNNDEGEAAGSGNGVARWFGGCSGRDTAAALHECPRIRALTSPNANFYPIFI